MSKKAGTEAVPKKAVAEAVRKKAVAKAVPKKAVAKAASKKAAAKAVPKKAVAKAASEKAVAKAVPKNAPAQPPPDSPRISFFDLYLGRGTCVPAKQLCQAMLPCHLVCAAMFFQAQRSRQPPRPFPPCTQLEYQPLQLQRFLRGCVLATAHALVTPPASVFRLVHAGTKSRCIERIFVRVMSGFVARTEVRRQGARCACACRAALARLFF